MQDSSDLARRAHVRLGTTLRGKYRLDSVLGIGGMAVVFAATHRNAKRFAVKMLHPELSLDASLCARFLREGYAANSVNHPGTVAVLDDDVTEDGAAFIVMELLDGVAVDALWQQHDRRLPVGPAVSIVEQLLDVLAAAHENGVVHRDIKPSNLFVTRDGALKVLDFGIARARDAANATAGALSTTTGMLLGTPAFMAPEQALANSSEIDALTDLWAAGATLFTLLSGRLVHEANNPSQLLVRAATEKAPPLGSVSPEVPAAIAHVVDRGLAFEKEARWPDAASMRVALCKAYASVFGRAPERFPPGGAPRPKAGPSRAPEGDPQHAHALSQRAGGTLAAPELSDWPAGASTARPVSAAGAPQSASRSPRSAAIRWIAMGAAMGISIVAAGAGVRAMRARAVTGEQAPAAVSAAVSNAPTVPAGAASLERVEPQPLPRAPDVPTNSMPPDAGRSESFVLTPPTPRAPAPKAAAPTPNCDPPFTIDTDGIKRPKPECL
jgi:eukaryotic-like serine/threonine-protein kinase